MTNVLNNGNFKVNKFIFSLIPQTKALSVVVVELLFPYQKGKLLLKIV